MMSQLPNAGDVARVVQVCGCCEKSLRLRDIFVTVTLIADAELVVCGHCYKSFPDVEMAFTDRGIVFMRRHLRRVPPLAELESIHIADEIESERPREKVMS